MTEAVSLKPDLGRFGVWLPTRSITPELAAKIESLGYGAVWIGGSPDAELAWVDPALAQTSSLQLATLIEAVVAYGTPDAIAKRLNEHLEAGADHVAIQVLGGWNEDILLPALSELAGPLGLSRHA